MKNALIFTCILLINARTTLSGQEYEAWLQSENYVPNLIRKGIDWKNIADSIRQFYPDQQKQLEQVLLADQLQKSRTPTEPCQVLIWQYLSNHNRTLLKELDDDLFKLGSKALPELIALLKTDAATRRIVYRERFEDPIFYQCVSDIAMHQIEAITSIYFFKNSAFPLNLFSNAPIEERNAIIKTIQIWYERAQNLNKREQINLFLTDFPHYKYGSPIYTATNLAKAGDTTNAIFHLKYYYNLWKLPCVSNILIANLIKDLGEDVAMDDCLHRIYDYRCMRESGVDCIWYILKNARADIPYNVLADIVATERYSRMKTNDNQYIWPTIFNEMALTKTRWAVPILVELMRIDLPVKGTSLNAHTWQQIYPDQYNALYRVCDFALWKLKELEPNTVPALNWDNQAERDAIIQQILSSKDVKH
jgi:hypothetical protein